jgi:hypothetical protein
MLCAAGEDEAIRKIVFRLLAANDGGDPKVVFEPALAQSRHGIFFTGAAGRGAPVKRPVPANQEA